MWGISQSLELYLSTLRIVVCLWFGFFSDDVLLFAFLCHACFVRASCASVYFVCSGCFCRYYIIIARP